MRAMRGDVMPAPAETAPAPTPAPQNTGQPATAPQLTAADVAAAMAANPVQPGAGTPVMAGDQDEVEPEWVNAAEQAMTETAGNPYAEEEAVESLQIDYLKKRYGYEVKKPDSK